ncbi:S-adenosyl-L-methionine-dependent methyltransferase [Favolaschia claudopus]|uniref:S-adenosyl-L-methionine-dependent methyltransferase n=1 Tax=Favolaschia claudopus TaxID=2862362 RepID=A0AAW0ALE7_9AGAR
MSSSHTSTSTPPDSQTETPLRHLLALLTQSISTLETACQTSNTPLPALSDPFSPASEAFRANADAAEAARTIAAAALQLEAVVSPPHLSLHRLVAGPYRAAALRICFESGVNEILREAGPQGLHVRDIATKNGQDAQKLARFMRFLTTHHFYREVSPDVFAHTRISSMLDTGKTSEEVLANPEHKHEGTIGLTALAAHHLDETFKAAAHAWDTLADTSTRNSGDPARAPLALSLGRNETLWEYYARPEERARRERFAIAMTGVKALQGGEEGLVAYPWSSLPAGTLIIDVGGGVGTSSLTLATKFPDRKFKFVVQDFEGVVQQGKELWKEKLPEAVSSGQVTFQAHDFFSPQPANIISMIATAPQTIFLLKQILHDWSNEYCVKILEQLSAAAAAGGKVGTAKVLLFEAVLPLGVQAEGEEGGEEKEKMLLPNYGGNELDYAGDFAMFLLFNAQERTEPQFSDLLARTGWELRAVHRQTGLGGEGTFIQCVEAGISKSNVSV